jgi:hypothetical protein
MAVNFLQNVITYQASNLAYLQNLNCFINISNTKFKDFENKVANLGDTISFDKPPRFIANNGLVVNFQSADQRVQTLTVDQAKNVPYAFTAQEMIFNVEDYMEKFGMGATRELSAVIEANVAQNCVTNTYRFFGDGVTPINSFGQLAQAIALFESYGSAAGPLTGVLQNTAVPAIVNAGLGQFAPNRNNEMANSWEVGEFSNCDWKKSNLLPVHVAGSAGNNAATLTVSAINPLGAPADGSITSLTFLVSGAPGVDANQVKKYDKFQFNDGVAGFPNVRFLTFTGHQPSQAPVQFQSTIDAASDGGSHVTVSIFPPLQAIVSNTQNLTAQIQIGMTCSVLPSHRAGLLMSGNPLYLAMPMLPDQSPFATSNKTDPDTGVSMRQYFGTLFGQNQQGMVHDAIWGSTMAQEYAMSLIFPL